MKDNIPRSIYSLDANSNGLNIDGNKGLKYPIYNSKKKKKKSEISLTTRVLHMITDFEK